MADIAIFRINYKSDFILTLNSDAGWMTPFCIKFWTGAPSQAYYAYYDGMSYTHCTPVEGEPTKLLVQFDDHHLPIGDLKFQIGYHFTVDDFPTSIEDEVINQAAVIIVNDGEQQQVMLDFNGETSPEIQFSLPAYANEAQRIANEQERIAAEEQRIANEQARISAEETRQTNEQQRISREQQRISQEQQRVNAEAERVSEFAELKTESEAATDAANIAATLSNEKAQLADDKAALAQAAADLANAKAQLAEDKAALANEKAALAQQKAEYAQEQGDAAKTEAETAHALNEEVRDDEAARDQAEQIRQQQETARQQAESQRVTDFNAQMQQQQTAYADAEAVRDTAFDEAETERDAKVDEKVADITNLQAQVGYFVCDTAAATAAKTIAATGYVLTTGGNIRIKMTNANTADAVTLNINSTGAKALFYNGEQASSTNSWEAGEVIEVYYDGTQYQCGSSKSITDYIDDTFLVEGAVAESSAVGNLFIKEFNIISIDSFNNWRRGNVVSMFVGHTYHIRFSTSATTNVLKIITGYDAENNSLSIVNVNVKGDYETDYTPTVDIVKVDFYVSAVSSVSITETNASKILLREDDVVNNLYEGGVNVPLSAEQGKVINNKVRILNTYKAKLSNGLFNIASYYSLSIDCKSAMSVIGNNNISDISIASGYEYQLYGKNDASYTSSTGLTLIRDWSSDIWKNNSSFGFIWLLVRRTDLNAISDSELSNIITISSQTSQYNVANVVDVENAFLIGERRKANMIKVSGEGLAFQDGSVKVSEAYTRSDYYNVTGISALIFGGNPGIYDNNRFNGSQIICWYDANYSYLGFTNYYWTRETMELIVAVPSNAVFVRINGFSEHITEIVKGNTLVSEYIRNNKSVSAIGNLKKVTFILCQGQSLFQGADAAGQTTDFSYYPLRMFNGSNPLKMSTNDDDYKSFQHLKTTSLGFETPMIGLGEMFVEAIQRENNISVYSNEWKDHLIVIGGPITGGITIEALSTDEKFAYMEAMIRNLKKLCDEFGYTFDAPAWCWMQGEQNVKNQMTTEDYKTALLAYHNRVCEAFSNIAGITNRPKCIIYQPACQCLFTQDYGYSNPYLQVLQAFAELLRDNDEFIASTPTYIFTPSTSGGSWIHLNAESYKVLGAYNGYALKRYIIDGVSNKGVIPLTITTNDNTIVIKYNVPSPPLVIDTDLVKEVNNFGFDVVTSDDRHIISNVSVHYDTVTIVCSESPVGAKLRYGLNGDTVRGIPDNPYTGQDGHEHGGRGNIRDSQGNFIYKDAFGKKIPMYNWAYCFEQIID